MKDKDVSKIKAITTKAKEFLDGKNQDIEKIQHSPFKQYLIFIKIVVDSFIKNRCLSRSSALAYTTLLGLIPMLAVAIGVTTSLLQKEGEKPIEQLIDKFVVYVAPALDLEVKKDGVETTGKRKEIVEKISGFISNIHSGALGGTGVAALIFIVVSMLRTIEKTFNDIWGVLKGRSFINAFIQYWAVITLGPLLLVFAIGLTSSPYFSQTKAIIDALGVLGNIIIFLLPFIILSIGFTIFYNLMPNTRVQWSAALVGGIVGGSLWQINSMCNALYVNRVVTYSKIYGSLGLLPVFLVGLYFSWVILLLGAQVAYAYQNRLAYLQEKLIESVNQYGREFVALRIMVHLCRAFEFGYGAQKMDSITKALGIPPQLAFKVLNMLVNEGLLISISDHETSYIPAKPIEKISAFDVINAMRRANGHEIDTANDTIRSFVRKCYDELVLTEKQVGEKMSMKQFALLEQAPTA